MTFEQVQKELIQAMKNKDTVRKSVLGDIKTTALNLAIEEKHKENVTEDNVLAAIKKYQKVCQAQIDTCPASRPDLMEAFQACMKCVNEYLPQQITFEEVQTAVKDFLVQFSINNPGPINKGLVMKEIMPKLKGKADGKMINQVVTEICNKAGE